MFFFVPYEIETLEQETPYVNWAIVGTCIVVFILQLCQVIGDAGYDLLVLDGWGVPGLLSHVFLHGGFFHLIGNMIFLWVFGNAICTNTNNGYYLAVFLACALLSAAAHNIFDGQPAIGASGAINGIVGIVFAMYPVNRVHCFWLIFIRGGTFSCPAWVLIIMWFLFDIWGATMGGGNIAYWAHIGGFLGGFAIGMTALYTGLFQVTEYDNRSLLEIIRREERD